MQNWKTTFGGVASILLGVGHFIYSISHNEAPDFTADGTAVLAGIGLIWANDPLPKSLNFGNSASQAPTSKN